MIYQSLPVIIFLASMIFPLCVALWVRRQRRDRRSPLTLQMLRAPGESLSNQIDALTDDIDTYLLMATIIPLACFSMYLSTRYIGGNIQVGWKIFLMLACGCMIFFCCKLVSLLRKRHDLFLGLDCERAIGQELNQLMLNGYRVYHDFPADNFNIDHIVFGPNGVFAVETKGRAKPVKSDTKQEWKVTFDGQALLFPNWKELEFLPQARRQAEWLAKWLSSAVGEQVQVRPVLALPGWFIDRLKPSDVYLFNGKNPLALTGKRPETPLSDSLIQRIAHQIEQKCRDVEPSAYKKEKKSN